MYLFFFTANIIIYYEHPLDLKPVCFDAVEALSRRAILIDFIPRTNLSP